MGAYVPELGQMFFGNKWEEFKVPAAIGDMLYELAEKLCDDINAYPAYGVEYTNEVFEMFPYHWGDCLCGFEEEEERWLEEHPHKENCFHIKYQKYEEELDKMGIKWYGDTKEKWKKLMTKFAKENGYTGIHGIASYCDCGRDKEYERWLETHGHKPDCPIVRPNFLYKPTGLAIYWYKYIGRGMSANQKISVNEFRKIIEHCIESAREDIEKATKAKNEQKRKIRWKKRGIYA